MAQLSPPRPPFHTDTQCTRTNKTVPYVNPTHPTWQVQLCSNWDSTKGCQVTCDGRTMLLHTVGQPVIHWLTVQVQPRLPSVECHNHCAVQYIAQVSRSLNMSTMPGWPAANKKPPAIHHAWCASCRAKTEESCFSYTLCSTTWCLKPCTSNGAIHTCTGCLFPHTGWRLPHTSHCLTQDKQYNTGVTKLQVIESNVPKSIDLLGHPNAAHPWLILTCTEARCSCLQANAHRFDARTR
jgi:hypothetical protein